MNLFPAPADISSKDLPLREDVRLLRRIFGETLREQEGEESFRLIENVRSAAVRFRKTQDDSDRVQLEQILDALSPSETLVVVRAFSYFSQLFNIAEDLHRNRRHRAHLKAGNAPKDGSLLLALKRIGEKNLSRGNAANLPERRAGLAGIDRASHRSAAQEHSRLPVDHYPAC